MCREWSRWETARAITQMCIMSSMRHESDLVLREDSLTRATTSLVQLCKPAGSNHRVCPMRRCTTSLCQSKEVGIKWLADQELRSLIWLRMRTKARPTILFKFRFAVADQYWRSTDFGHHRFHVARVHDHSPLPVPWWCLQCQMRWSTQRPVSNSIQLRNLEAVRGHWYPQRSCSGLPVNHHPRRGS